MALSLQSPLILRGLYKSEVPVGMADLFAFQCAYQVDLGYGQPCVDIVKAREHILCAFAELAEMLNSFSWRPHRYAQFINTREASEEFVDTLVFMINAAMYLGLTGVDVDAAVLRVLKKNVERLETGVNRAQKQE